MFLPTIENFSLGLSKHTKPIVVFWGNEILWGYQGCICTTNLHVTIFYILDYNQIWWKMGLDFRPTARSGKWQLRFYSSGHVLLNCCLKHKIIQAGAVFVQKRGHYPPFDVPFMFTLALKFAMTLNPYFCKRLNDNWLPKTKRCL